jgi:hypothetical protein
MNELEDWKKAANNGCFFPFAYYYTMNGHGIHYDVAADIGNRDPGVYCGSKK